MKGLTVSVVLTGALAAAPMASAQLFERDQEQQQQQLQPETSSFLEQAAQGNIAEMELADEAQERAASEDVKFYARHLQQSHELANERLETIAEKNNVELPDEASQQGQQLKEKLSELEGEEFDRQYLEAMIGDHKKTIQRFEQQAEQAQDQEVQQYATMMLPALRAHLEMAQQLQQQVQGGAGQQQQQQQQQQQRQTQ